MSAKPSLDLLRAFSLVMAISLATPKATGELTERVGVLGPAPEAAVGPALEAELREMGLRVIQLATDRSETDWRTAADVARRHGLAAAIWLSQGPPMRADFVVIAPHSSRVSHHTVEPDEGLSKKVRARAFVARTVELLRAALRQSASEKSGDASDRNASPPRPQGASPTASARASQRPPVSPVPAAPGAPSPVSPPSPNRNHLAPLPMHAGVAGTLVLPLGLFSAGIVMTGRLGYSPVSRLWVVASGGGTLLRIGRVACGCAAGAGDCCAGANPSLTWLGAGAEFRPISPSGIPDGYLNAELGAVVRNIWRFAAKAEAGAEGHLGRLSFGPALGVMYAVPEGEINEGPSIAVTLGIRATLAFELERKLDDSPAKR